MRNARAFAFALLVLSGCATGTAQQRSAGPTGCAASDITIEDMHASLVRGTWTARCHGRIYHCTAADQTTDCTPDPSTPPPPQPAARPSRFRTSSPR